MVELVNAALAVANTIFIDTSGKTANASPYACTQLRSLVAQYALDAELKNAESKAVLDTHTVTVISGTCTR